MKSAARKFQRRVKLAMERAYEVKRAADCLELTRDMLGGDKAKRMRAWYRFTMLHGYPGDRESKSAVAKFVEEEKKRIPPPGMHPPSSTGAPSSAPDKDTMGHGDLPKR